MVPDAARRDHRGAGADLQRPDAAPRAARVAGAGLGLHDRARSRISRSRICRTVRPGSAGGWSSRNTARAGRPTPSSSLGCGSIFNDAGVHWQTHAYRAGYGGGTIAQWFANANIDAIDVGIGILSMHSPMDVSAKVDLWELYRGFKAFLGASPRRRRRHASATLTARRRRAASTDLVRSKLSASMRIFLTGATGYIGAAVLDALVRGGHEVTALVRDNEKAARVTARGAHPVVGNLGEPESYRAAADAQDGYIHTAFDGRRDADRRSIASRSKRSSRRRSGRARPDRTAPPTRFVIYTSGVWVLGRAPRAGGRRRAGQSRFRSWRGGPAHEELVLGAAATPADDRRPARRRVRRRQRPGRRSVQVGDQRSGPRHRRRQQPLAARLRSRPGRSLRAAGRRAKMPPASITPTTKATSASTTSSRRSRRTVGSARRAARADRRGAGEDGRLCRRAVARSARPQPARPGARLDAQPPLGRRQRRAAARRVAGVDGTSDSGSRLTTQRSG